MDEGWVGWYTEEELSGSALYSLALGVVVEWLARWLPNLVAPGSKPVGATCLLICAIQMV